MEKVLLMLKSVCDVQLLAGRNANELLDHAQKIELSSYEKIRIHKDNDVVSLAKDVVRNTDDEACEHGESINNDDDDENNFVGDGNDVAAAANGNIQRAPGSLKRKRESLSLPEMLNWLMLAAKHSDDPAVGMIPESSKCKQHGSDDLWVQALLAREALLIKRPVDLNTDISVMLLYDTLFILVGSLTTVRKIGSSFNFGLFACENPKIKKCTDESFWLKLLKKNVADYQGGSGPSELSNFFFLF